MSADQKINGTLGIYGGTFSPPHDGHMHAVAAFLDECALDALYVIPARVPPHKSALTDVTPRDRLEMLKIALDERRFGPRVTVSDWEIKQRGKSYTYRTLEHFSRLADRLVFLVGTDMLLTFHQWREPQRIASLARLAFINREDETPSGAAAIERQIEFLRSEYGADIVTLGVKALPMSSTDIRRALENGEKPAGISRGVYDYIKERRLYGS